MKTNTTQTTRTDRNRIREMYIQWRVFSGEGEGNGEKIQEIRNIIVRHKIDGERLRMV